MSKKQAWTFFDIFSSVNKVITIHMLQNNRTSKSLYLIKVKKTIFLHVDLEEIYMHISPRDTLGTTKSMMSKLQKRLYGLVQAPNQKITFKFHWDNFKIWYIYVCCYTKRYKDSNILILYVNNIVNTRKDKQKIIDLRRTLNWIFEMLGMHIHKGQSKKLMSFSKE